MDAAVLPPYPNNKNRRGRIVGVPDGKPYYFTITDEIARPQKDLPTKLLCLQRLKFDDDGREEIRVGYYIIGKKENRRGKWVWGQYCTLMPMSDFQALIGSAEERGWMTHAPTSPD
jgi:hypothetical protein